MTTAIAWKPKDRAYYQDEFCTIEELGTGKRKSKVRVATPDDCEGIWVDAKLLTRSKNGRNELTAVNDNVQNHHSFTLAVVQAKHQPSSIPMPLLPV